MFSLTEDLRKENHIIMYCLGDFFGFFFMFKVLLDLESKVYTIALLRGRIKELLYKYHLQSKAHGLQTSKSLASQHF